MVRFAKEEEDFDWCYKLACHEDKLLGPCLPFPLRERMQCGEVAVTDDKTAFCEFHVAKKFGHISVYHICTAPEARKQGKARELLEFLRANFEYPIQAVCITGTSSEDFWSRVAKKVDTKYSKTGTELSVFRIGEEIKRLKKEVLF